MCFLHKLKKEEKRTLSEQFFSASFLFFQNRAKPHYFIKTEERKEKRLNLSLSFLSSLWY